MAGFGALDTSASGMTAQRLRTDIIAQNVANVNTTRDADGNVYRRKTVVFQEKSKTNFNSALNLALGRTNNSQGVKVVEIVEDQSEGRMVYDPSHPDANAEGYVTYPNVNTVTEMTNLIDASRSYEANVTAFNATKAMAMKALELGK